MKIYDFPWAPNPRKVRVYVLEKGLSIPFQTIDLAAGENKTPEFLAKNPTGSLPVLALDDGGYLTESLVIMEYLEDCFPNPPMLGLSPLERARVRELERFAEHNIFNPIGRIFFNTNALFVERDQVPEAAAQARRGLDRAFAIMDQAIGTHPFIAGEHPTLADCTLFSAFELAQRAQVTIDERYQNLTRWYRAFRQRPSAQV